MRERLSSRPPTDSRLTSDTARPGAPTLQRRPPARTGAATPPLVHGEGVVEEPGLEQDTADSDESNRAAPRGQSASGSAGEVPPVVHDVLRGIGRPLDRGLRGAFEAHFGHDFSRIRVHTDARAAASAAAVGAAAYSVGPHLVFGAGRYAPHTPAGRALLAHELTHSAEQPGAVARPGELVLGTTHDPAEAFAQRASEVGDPLAPRGSRGPALPLHLTAGTPGQRLPAVLRRQSVTGPAPQAAAGPGPDDDPIDPFDYPDWGWYLLSGDFRAMPTLAQAHEALGRYRPALIPLLLDATAIPHQSRNPGGYAYFVLRHPTAGVLARIYFAVSGSGRTSSDTFYGIYIFLPEREGEALISGGRRTGTVTRDEARPADSTRAQGAPPPRDPLLDLYFQRFPPEAGGTPTSVVSPEMRLRLALSLADRGFFGSVYDAAMDAITNPLFIVQTVLMIGVYVGLWLTPDPTLLTKVAAAALTAVLLALFTWNDLIGFARAWFRLQEASAAAGTEAELRAAGNDFMRTLGQVGFDVFLMILFWGMGRAARAPLRAARARIATEATARARADVTAAEARPGSGGARPGVTAPEVQTLAQARAAAGSGATPTQVLDQLANLLPEAARRGLANERAAQAARARGNPAQADARTLATLEARTRGGADIFRWLEERGLSEEQTGAARQELADAQARLARARLIELRGLEDFPTGRRSMLADLRNTLMDFARALRRVSARFRRAAQTGEVDTVVGELGEALARGQLTARLPAGQEVITSLELARRVPGFRTVAEWAAAERAAGRNPQANLGRMRQGPDGVYESVGQIDNAVVQRTPDGRLRVLEIEETKTGGETGESARAQVTRARDHLADIDAGRTDVRIYERPSSTSVGADLTGRFDLSQGARIGARTRGPEGRTGFDESLGVSRDDLAAVARQIIAEGTPPGEPGPTRGVVTSGPGRPGPEDERRDRQPAPP